MKVTYRASALAAAVLVVLVLGGNPAIADEIRDMQWHLGYLNIDEAHRHSQGDGVVIGLLDTGVDAEHPDLKGSIDSGRDFTADQGDGRRDQSGHGTMMAGLLVAHGRALGIAPHSIILPVRLHRFDDDAGAGTEAAEWAIDHGARVLCLAYTEAESIAGRLAIERAIRQDVVVVAGVGNVPDSVEPFPAGYDGVIGAAGVNRDGSHAPVSVVSPFADLAAPAVDIVSTDSRTVEGRTPYSKSTGTSDATAIIAGAAALVRARFPDMSAAEVIHRLIVTADDKGPPGRDDEYGYGVINIVKALTADVPPLTPFATPTVAAPPTDDGNGRAVFTIVALSLVVILTATSYALYLRRRRHDS